MRTPQDSGGSFRSKLVLPEGLEAGLIGGFAVVAAFLIRDLMLGDLYHTPALLGTVLLRGVAATREGGTVDGAAAAYHVLHFSVWVGLGFALSALAARAERRPALRALLWAVLAATALALVGLDLWLGSSGIAAPRFWLGGIVGVAAMTAFLAWRHPAALRGSADS